MSENASFIWGNITLRLWTYRTKFSTCKRMMTKSKLEKEVLRVLKEKGFGTVTTTKKASNLKGPLHPVSLKISKSLAKTLKKKGVNMSQVCRAALKAAV